MEKNVAMREKKNIPVPSLHFIPPRYASRVRLDPEFRAPFGGLSSSSSLKEKLEILLSQSLDGRKRIQSSFSLSLIPFTT